MFLAVVLFALSPSLGRWDRQALPATQREERRRERDIHIDGGGGMLLEKSKTTAKNSGASSFTFSIRRINHIRGRYRFKSGFKGTYSVRLYRIGK